MVDNCIATKSSPFKVNYRRELRIGFKIKKGEAYKSRGFCEINKEDI